MKIAAPFFFIKEPSRFEFVLKFFPYRGTGRHWMSSALFFLTPGRTYNMPNEVSQVSAAGITHNYRIPDRRIS